MPREPLGDLHEQVVAQHVAVAVVDELEVVDVHEEHGDLRRLFWRPGQGVFDTVLEQHAVGEPGESVVEGLMLEFVLEADALADVTRVNTRPCTCGSSRRLATTVSVKCHVPSWSLMRHSPRVLLPGRLAQCATSDSMAAEVVGVHQVAELAFGRARRRA